MLNTHVSREWAPTANPLLERLLTVMCVQYNFSCYVFTFSCL